MNVDPMSSVGAYGVHLGAGFLLFVDFTLKNFSGLLSSLVLMKIEGVKVVFSTCQPYLGGKVFVDFNLSTMLFFDGRIEMAEASKKSYINTTVTTNLLKSLKTLDAQEGMRLNQLLEEAIRDLLKTYEKKDKK